MSEDIQALTNTLVTTLAQAAQAQQPVQPVPEAPQAPPAQPQDVAAVAAAPPSQPATEPAPEGANPETPTRRRPGRPKGSGKKQLEVIQVQEQQPRVKRPVGRPRKDGLPAGSVGPKRPAGRPKKRPPGTFASGSASQAPQVLTYTVRALSIDKLD